MRLPSLLILLIIQLCTPRVQAQVIEVPGDFSTIQAAIDISAIGDSIHIGQGVYTENLVIPHELTIFSDYLLTGDEADIAATIIDGDSLESVIRAIDPLGSKMEFIGITVQNGVGHPYPVQELPDTTLYLNFGGGFHLIGIEELVLDHVISRNNIIATQHNSGGGLFAESCGVILRDCLVEENQVQGNSFFGEGAGLCFYSCDIAIYNTVIQNNNALPGYAEGSGIHTVDSEVYLEEVDILDNTGPNSAAFNFQASNIEMVDCNVIGNSAGHSDAAKFNAFSADTEFIVENCYFGLNHGHQSSSFNLSWGQITIKNSVFEENSATFGPVCLRMNNSEFLIEDCSFLGNNCGNGSSLSCDAGAIQTWQSSGSINRTLIMNNTIGLPSGTAEGGGLDFSGGTIEMDSVIIQGNVGGNGGGFKAHNCEITLRNSAILDNEANNGGGIHSLDCDWNIINSTIAGNSANNGAGIWTYSDTITVVNSILWNEDGDEIFGYESTWNDTSHYHLAYSTLRGMGAETGNPDYVIYNFGAGNLDVAPVFVDAENGDYRLDAGAAQIDTGTDFYEWNGTVLLDTDDFMGSAPDMGYTESLVSSIHDMEASQIHLYPNPANGAVAIPLPADQILAVQFYDIKGKLVLESSSRYIDITSLPSGLYQTRILSDEAIQHVPLVVE